MSVPISAVLTPAHLPSKGQMVCSRPEGIWKDFRLDAWVTSPCTRGELCVCVHRRFEEAILLPTHFKSNIHRR